MAMTTSNSTSVKPPRGPARWCRMRVLPEREALPRPWSPPGAWSGVTRGRCIPNLDRAVRTGRRQAPPVRAEGRPADLAGVRQGKRLLASGHVPEARGTVLTGRGQAPPVGAETQAADGAGMAL